MRGKDCQKSHDYANSINKGVTTRMGETTWWYNKKNWVIQDSLNFKTYSLMERNLLLESIDQKHSSLTLKINLNLNFKSREREGLSLASYQTHVQYVFKTLQFSCFDPLNIMIQVQLGVGFNFSGALAFEMPFTVFHSILQT